MNKALYTIGYSAFDTDAMISILRELSINCVVDVRSMPMSAYAPQYNKDTITSVLKTYGILYRHYPEFGARQDDRNYYTEQGYLDFDKYIQSKRFTNGMEKIKKGLDMQYSFTFMCAEKDPINCHRAIMVAKAFSKENYPIKHIVPDKSHRFRIESQKDLENRLVNLNGDDLNQMSLFESDDIRIQSAYKRQNKVIGYRLDDNE